MKMNMNRGVRDPEHRIFERVPCSLPVQAKIFSSSATIDAKTCDVSGGGIGLVAKQSIPEGDEVTLRITFSPQFDPLMQKGRVVWSRQEASGFWRSGIQFSSLDIYKLGLLLRRS